MHSAPAGTTQRDDKGTTLLRKEKKSYIDTKVQKGKTNAMPEYLKQTPEQRAAEVLKKSRAAIDANKQTLENKQQVNGSLALDSIFSDEEDTTALQTSADDLNDPTSNKTLPLSTRNAQNMAASIDPRPNARAQWQRKMVIRDVKRSGRPTRAMLLARTERTAQVKSAFFKTSIKKLSPLARQIAGKSIEEAIIQMRFSKKKVAKDVLKHLIHARNYAIVAHGMGLNPNAASLEKLVPKVPQAEDIEAAIQSVVETKYFDSTKATVPTVTSQAVLPNNPVIISDPSNSPALPYQNPNKSLTKGTGRNPTDIYIAQAWVNRGPYGSEASPRARGRMDILKPPHTGVSVLLKEEKTRTREKAEKELKAIRKRMNGKIWTQLPDRAITRQTQHVLW